MDAAALWALLRFQWAAGARVAIRANAIVFRGLAAVSAERVVRLAAGVALALHAAALANVVVQVRPAWAWARSLPWSAAQRVWSDIAALSIPLLISPAVALLLRPRAGLVVLALVPFVAAAAALAPRHAARRQTGAAVLGQRRRAMLATALVGDPEVVVLDEPLESMDRATRDFLLARVAEWRDRGACVLVATHELEPFSSLADGVVSVLGGRLSHVTKLPAAAADRTALFTKAATVGI